MHDPTDPIYNEAALHCYSHAQLKHLCKNRGVDGRGNSNTLRARLRNLRDTGASAHSDSGDAAMPSVDEESFDVVEASHHNTSKENRQSHGYLNEMGVLSTDPTAQTIPKSSSWTEKLSLKASRIFGASSSSSSLSNMTKSSSSNSISSLASNATVTCAKPSSASFSSANNSSTSGGRERERHSSTTYTASTCLADSSIADSGIPSTPYIRQVLAATDGSSHANPDQTALDISFAPRRSFDDDSVALENVPVWPPPAGVILLSPRESPPKAEAPGLKAGGNKRRLGIEDELEDEDGDGEMTFDESSYHCAIRLLPRTGPLSPGAAGSRQELSPPRSDRRISKLPKRYSEIARSPPRFEAEAPALPSLASVMSTLKPVQAASDKDVEDTKLQIPGAFDLDKERSETDRASSSTMFVFGSPAQKPVTQDSFTKAMSKAGIARPPAPTASLPPIPPVATESSAALQAVWAQLQARAGTVSTGSMINEKGQLVSCQTGNFTGVGTTRPGPMKRNESVRFQDVHDKEFAKSDSIASHYAAKRAFLPHKKTKIEPSLSSMTLSAHARPEAVGIPSSSPFLQLPLSGSAIPRKPSTASLVAHPSSSSGSMTLHNLGALPQPRAIKTKVQQKADADRIKTFAYGPKEASMRPSVSPRKMNHRIADSQRRIPIVPTKPVSSSAVKHGDTDQELPRSTSNPSLASKIFKNPFGSLKSVTSSSSLSAKNTNHPEVAETGKSYPKLPSLTSDSSLAQRPASTYDAASYLRPTLASLNRTSSILSLKSRPSANNYSISGPIAATPAKLPLTEEEQKAISGSKADKAKNAENRQIPLSPSHLSALPGNIGRPASFSKMSASPAKKRIAAQRHAILGTTATDGIQHARKIRARRDVSVAGPTNNTASEAGLSSIANSPDKSAMTGMSNIDASSAVLSGRDRWR